jgi:hypothetical protein
MRNIFLQYMPVGNVEAMTPYPCTIHLRADFERIARFTPRTVVGRIKQIFGERWGRIVRG